MQHILKMRCILTTPHSALATPVPQLVDARVGFLRRTHVADIGERSEVSQAVPAQIAAAAAHDDLGRDDELLDGPRMAEPGPGNHLHQAASHRVEREQFALASRMLLFQEVGLPVENELACVVVIEVAN